MAVAVRETCSCGAEFIWAGTYASDGDRAAQEWRAHHRHDRPSAPNDMKGGDDGRE